MINGNYSTPEPQSKQKRDHFRFIFTAIAMGGMVATMASIVKQSFKNILLSDKFYTSIPCTLRCFTRQKNLPRLGSRNLRLPNADQMRSANRVCRFSFPFMRDEKPLNRLEIKASQTFKQILHRSFHFISSPYMSSGTTGIFIVAASGIGRCGIDKLPP